MAKTPFVQTRQQSRPQDIGCRWGVTVVIDAQAAAKVQVVDGDACGLDLLNQIQHLVQSVQVRFAGGDLRTDVAVDAHHFQARQRRSVLVGLQGALMRHAEFVALEARRNIGVGFRVHIGIDADADRRHFAAGQCHLAQHIQFGFAFHIEASNARLQGLLHFGAAFTHARKNHIFGLATSGQHTCQFATRHNVKTTACLGKHLQHPQ